MTIEESLKVFNKRLFQATVVHFSSIIMFILGFIASYLFINVYIALIVSILYFILSLILLFILDKKEMYKSMFISGLLVNLFSGVLIGSLMSRFDLNIYDISLKLLIYFSAIIVSTYIMIRVFPYKRSLIIFTLLIIIGLIIYFTRNINVIDYRICSIISFYLLLLYSGFTLYVFSGKDFELCLAFGFYVTLVIIIIFVLAILAYCDSIDTGGNGLGLGKDRMIDNTEYIIYH